MKLSVVALDYDGTIAEGGALDPDARAALSDARERGIVVIVVSGRILDDLRRVTGNLSWTDAVVAENGAVVALPGGYIQPLAAAPSHAVQLALNAAGVPFQTGHCVLETGAEHAGRVLELVRSLEAPVALHFNRERLMLLPHGICKAAGLREALRHLRLSSHNTLAIGDAENDHDLLELCEVGAAVAWGSRALQEIADDVVPGAGPRDVAPYLRRALDRMRLPEARCARRFVTLGRAADGRSVDLAVRGRNLLIVGEPRSGKSRATGVLCEHLILMGYSLCIVDPEGDYVGLEALPGVVLFGGAYALPGATEISRALRYPDSSFVFDLSRLGHDAKTSYLRMLLAALTRFRGTTGIPHRVVIDEAHYFLDRPDTREFIDYELGGYLLVTYRVSDLHPDILATADAVVMTHTTDPRELAVLAKVARCAKDAALREVLADLAIDEAALVEPSRSGETHVERFRVAPRLTTHVRHQAKYRDVPLPEEHAFVFTRSSRPIGARTRTLRAFANELARAPPDVLEGHARRGDFSRWIGDVFGDQPLALDLRLIEERVRHGEELRRTLMDAISLRYELRGDGGPTTA